MQCPKLFVNVMLTGVMLFGAHLLTAQTQTTNSLQLEGNAGSLQYPAGWSAQNYANLHEVWNATQQQLAALDPDARDEVARIRTSVTPCADHAEALRRLQQIEAEWGMTSTYLVINGWAALQRRVLVPKPEEGDDTSASVQYLVMVTTAVAAEASVIRSDGFAPETASPQVIAQMETIAHSLRPATAGQPIQATGEVQQLISSPSLRMPLPSSPSTAALAAAAAVSAQPAPEVPAIVPGPATNLGTSNLQIGSESEISVSTNGTNIVVAQQCSFKTSGDGGATFAFGGGAPGHCTGGDSSLAFGQSGNFYWSTIGSNTSTCAGGKNCNNTQQIASSTNNGQSFSFLTNVIDCLTTSGCGFGNVPDQEHIASDRVNAGGSGKDQVYLVFREGFGYGISCSTDSGSTWNAVTFYNNGSTDFPRITVGQDGTVYVVTNNGNNIELDSFSQCKSGLTHNLNHVTIASGINQVSCPVAGLDRCNNGNILSSHTVAVDDTNANHLYAAYAVNTVTPAANASFPGNENILVRESTNGGSTWSSAVQVNSGTSGTGGRRFQPWLCVTEGTAFVSWFDRRASTSGSNDLTDYYSSSAFDIGGTLTAGTDFRINGAADPQCASGWPCQSRSPSDSTSCSTQPQFGGTCRHTPNGPTDSNTPCNFASPVCAVSGETCQGGSGCPKYADYTGNACMLGRLYNVWPSATNQPGAASTNGNIVSFFAETPVAKTATTTTYLGPVQAPLNSTVTLSAALVLEGTSVPVIGQSITFTLGSQTCSSTTSSTGFASCNITLAQPAGSYTVQATFAGSGNLQGSADSKPFAIVAPPSIVKSFAPTKIVPGGTTVLTVSITNPNASINLTGVGFSDSLPTGLMIASPNGLTSTCNGTAVAVPNSGLLTLAAGSITAANSCTITVSLAANNNDGVYNNVTSTVTSKEGGMGNFASATVTVAHPPTIAKNFSALAIPAGGSATLTFTITNPNTVVAFTGVAFTDSLPPGLTVSTPSGLTGTCAGGVITATSGGSVITLSGASLAAGASCTFSVNVTASVTGPIVNVTDPVTSNQTIPGNTASATIAVGSVFQVNYSANLNIGDSVINIVNTGENGASVDGPGFGTPTGNLCVNVYAFDPGEELISCCSCLVTPDALASLSLAKDVLANTANGSKPSSVVIKLVTTLAGTGGSATTCTNSAAVPGVLVSGLSAWGTTLHATPTPGDYAVTDKNFTQATLSAQELASLTGRCTAAVGNNSGAGVCNSCRSGGLGAERQ